MIEARYHDSVNVLQGLSLQGDAVASPFDRAEWFQLLADAGLKPLVAIASDADSDAALALTEHRGRITPLRNWYTFTWRQLASADEAGDRLLEGIARQLKTRGHRVTLEPVPDEDGSASRLARAFGAAGWYVEVTPCDVNHVLRVNQRSFAEYWATRPGALRTTRERKAAKVEVSIRTDFDPAAWSEYEQIYAKSWKPAEDYPEMLRAFASAEGDAGRLRLGIATFDGLPIAAQFWTVENRTAYIHKLAHLQSHRPLSAGTILTAELFRHVIDRDSVELIDFGTGDEPYKADWMEETRPRFRVDCISPHSPRSWIDLAKRSARRLGQSRMTKLAHRTGGG